MPSTQFHHVLQVLRESPQPEGVPLPEQRATENLLATQTPILEGCEVAQQTLAGPTGEPLPAMLISSAAATDRQVILYLHGGGYALGSPQTHRDLACRLSALSGAQVLLPDYRLAPEHPFPAAVEDATAAFFWLRQRGILPEQIVVGGDSAGGGLALALLLRLRGRKRPLPAAAFCLSPWVDLALTGASIRQNAAKDPLLTPAQLADFARMYLGDVDPRTPLASPLYADLRGLPPLFIQVGTAEILLDDALRLADRGEAAGVAVTRDVCPEMFHGWQGFARLMPEAFAALERVGAFVRERST